MLEQTPDSLCNPDAGNRTEGDQVYGAGTGVCKILERQASVTPQRFAARCAITPQVPPQGMLKPRIGWLALRDGSSFGRPWSVRLAAPCPGRYFLGSRSAIFPKLGLHLTKLRALRGEQLDLCIRQMFK